MKLGRTGAVGAGALMASVLGTGHALAADSGGGQTDAAAAAQVQTLLKSLHPIKGDVTVPKADVTLHLGDKYYFLDAADAKRVLTEGWGNPADAVQDTLGMVFPTGKTFADDSWGAVLTYQNDGYVSDKEARSTNYDKLLQDMRKGEDDDNAERKKNNFSPVHLVGWAQSPSYDFIHHSLIWAKDLQFGDRKVDTLNYDVRELGRRGVLSMNIVSDMSHLDLVRPAAANLGAAADFNPGSRYADYRDGTDKKAAYGIAGLIAAGAGVAVAQKFGLVALVILFIKKGAVLIAAGAAAMSTRFKKLFGKKKPQTGAVDL